LAEGLKPIAPRLEEHLRVAPQWPAGVLPEGTFRIVQEYLAGPSPRQPVPQVEALLQWMAEQRAP